jgi:hypothetical protein
LSARREAFLAQVDRLTAADTSEELSATDQEIVGLLGTLKSAQLEYPPALLAARRSAFLRQMERAGETSLLDKLRLSIQRVFSSKTTTSNAPLPGLMRISLVIGSLVAAALIGSLFFSSPEASFQPSPSQVAASPTRLLPTSTDAVALLICTPGDPTPSCASGELDPNDDLADPRNGPAQPAVSSDEAHQAAYVNDGQGGASWVSDSPDSWIKIDLGTVRTINTVSLRKGVLDSSQANDPGQFVIEVALSDVYTDGDSRNDSMEYAQVFRSESTGFSGTISQTETIQTQFPSVKARFIKIRFEKAGAAVEEVGVFMVQQPELAAKPTRTPSVDAPGITSTPVSTQLAMDTATSVAAGTALATDTTIPFPSPTDTPASLPTNTPPPAVTSTPVLIYPIPSDTPIPPVVEPSPTSPETILVSGSDQTWQCRGNPGPCKYSDLPRFLQQYHRDWQRQPGVLGIRFPPHYR